METTEQRSVCSYLILTGFVCGAVGFMYVFVYNCVLVCDFRHKVHRQRSVYIHLTVDINCMGVKIKNNKSNLYLVEAVMLVSSLTE